MISDQMSPGGFLFSDVRPTPNVYRHFSQDTTNEDSVNEDQYEENIRNKILEAALPYVLELGWSKQAIAEGAKVVGYHGVTHGMFIGSGGDLVNYFQKISNQKLVDYLKKNQDQLKPPPVGRKVVEDAVHKRLEMIVPYVSRWPQAVAVMSLPQNVPNSLATLLTMVDDICYYAGDQSVDFNWYARRVALAGLYKATELYLIQDKSAHNEKTWQFLHNRLTELLQVHDLLNKSDLSKFGSKESVTSAFATARNILGLNWNR